LSENGADSWIFIEVHVISPFMYVSNCTETLLRGMSDPIFRFQSDLVIDIAIYIPVTAYHTAREVNSY
jgi:hypothetical protein